MKKRIYKIIVITFLFMMSLPFGSVSAENQFETYEDVVKAVEMSYFEYDDQYYIAFDIEETDNHVQWDFDTTQALKGERVLELLDELINEDGSNPTLNKEYIADYARIGVAADFPDNQKRINQSVDFMEFYLPILEEVYSLRDYGVVFKDIEEAKAFDEKIKVLHDEVGIHFYTAQNTAEQYIGDAMMGMMPGINTQIEPDYYYEMAEANSMMSIIDSFLVEIGDLQEETSEPDLDDADDSSSEEFEIELSSSDDEKEGISPWWYVGLPVCVVVLILLIWFFKIKIIK